MAENIKYKTNVVGLDELLRGGLELPASGNGLIVLIKGRPGTGKTTLALQFACAALDWQFPDQTGIEIYTYEQHSQDIKNLLAGRLKTDNVVIASAVGNPKAGPHISIEQNPDYFYSSEVPIDYKETPLTWATRLTAKLNNYEEKLRLVVVDGLNIIRAEARSILPIENLVLAMKKNCLVGILVFESGGSETGGVDSQVDLVLELLGKEFEGPPNYYLNRISIVKSRFQASVLGWHQYKIRDNGLTIFPSLHYRISRINNLEERLVDSKKSLSESTVTEEKAKSVADKSVLAALIGKENLKQGSSTVVLGPRRTWKTQLTFDFLRAGTEIDHPGLLVSLLDNQGTIVGERRHLCDQYCIRDFKCPDNKKCYEQVYLLYFRPGCLASAEFFYYLERRLNEPAPAQQGSIQRLVFWDLTQLESRFPLLAKDRMFLAGLMDYLKNSEYMDKDGNTKKRLITSLFMGAPNMKLAQEASAMADNVVFCWQDSHRDYKEPGVALYVDRIEGKPGGKRLAFLNIGANKNATDIEKLLILDCNEDDLPYAESMLEEIRNLQGLPASRLTKKFTRKASNGKEDKSKA